MAGFDGNPFSPPGARAPKRETEPPKSGMRERGDRVAIRRLLADARLEVVVHERAVQTFAQESSPTAKRVFRRARCLAALALRMQAASRQSSNSDRIEERANHLVEELAVLVEVEPPELPFFDRPIELGDRAALRVAAERIHGLPVLLWALRIVERRGERWPTLEESVLALEAFVAQKAPPRLRGIFELERAFDRLLEDIAGFHGLDVARRYIAEGRFRAISWLRGAAPKYSDVDTASVSGR